LYSAVHSVFCFVFCSAFCILFCILLQNLYSVLYRSAGQVVSKNAFLRQFVSGSQIRTPMNFLLNFNH
jgi:hypothetical protein